MIMALRKTYFQMTDMNHFALIDFDDMIELCLGAMERGPKRRFLAMKKVAVACRKCGHQEVVFVWRKQGFHEFPNVHPFTAIVARCIIIPRPYDEKRCHELPVPSTNHKRTVFT